MRDLYVVSSIPARGLAALFMTHFAPLHFVPSWYLFSISSAIVILCIALWGRLF